MSRTNELIVPTLYYEDLNGYDSAVYPSYEEAPSAETWIPGNVTSSGNSL